MKLVNCILRPGRVMEVLENGAIKAEVPGLFDRTELDKCPPIYHTPWGDHANSYTQPKKYDEVWILNTTDNPLQLHWFRKDNYSKHNADLIKEENVEVLCNRESGMGWATIYFSDGSGWVISKNDSIINIKADGGIILKTPTPHRVIDINTQNISIGSEGESAHPAAYGDKTQEALQKICELFKSIQVVTQTNPYTTMISTAITSKLPGIEDTIGPIASQHVTID